MSMRPNPNVVRYRRYEQREPAPGRWYWTAAAHVATIATLGAILASAARGADYYSVGAYHSFWPRSSESDEIEASRPNGAALTVAAGWHVADKARLEIEITARAQKIHGINYANRSLSADGNVAWIGSAHVNAAYDVVTWRDWTPYAFAGIGMTGGLVRYYGWFDDSGRELDDDFMAPSAQIGVGVSYGMADLSIRYVRPMAVGIGYDGQSLDAVFDTIMTGVAVRW